MKFRNVVRRIRRLRNCAMFGRENKIQIKGDYIVVFLPNIKFTILVPRNSSNEASELQKVGHFPAFKDFTIAKCSAKPSFDTINPY